MSGFRLTTPITSRSRRNQPRAYGTSPQPSRPVRPDTTNTLQLTLVNAAQTMSGGVQLDADQMRTLLLVDGR